MTDTDRRWHAVRALLSSARAYDAAMRDLSMPMQLRDEATRAYCRDVDALVAELARLDDADELPGVARPDVAFRRRVA